MATDQRSGFRFGWGSQGTASDAKSAPEAADESSEATAQAAPPAEDEGAREDPAGGDRVEPTAASANDVSGGDTQPESGPAEASEQVVTPDVSSIVSQDASSTAEQAAPPVEPTEPAQAPPAPEAAPLAAADASPRAPRFVSELVRAMHAAAQHNRDVTVSQFRSDAKSFVEGIRERSVTDADDLRRAADQDVSAIRAWSEAEIARIKAETEDRIARRQQELEQRLQEHASLVDREIRQVEIQIRSFEEEVDRFFSSLEAIEDLTELASRAQRIPEPPPLEAIGAEARAQAQAELSGVSNRSTGAAANDATDHPAPVETSASAGAAEAVAAVETLEPTPRGETSASAPPAEPVDRPTPESSMPAFAAPQVGTDAVDPRLAAFGMLPGEPFESEPGVDRQTDAWGAPAPAQPSEVIEPGSGGQVPWPAPEAGHGDERRPDSDDAAISTDTDSGTGPDETGDEASPAARLAGLVPSSETPANGRTATANPERQPTQVVVTGLLSVASIASFKRHLSRVPGVQTVGVSSGPEGEFIFKTTHEPGVALGEVIPAFPGFGAEIVNGSEGTLQVAAHDPEADA